MELRPVSPLEDESPPMPVLSASADIRQRVAALAAQARAGQEDFATAAAAARRAAPGAGAVGSEGWIVAQQALSRAEIAGGRTTDALADLDQLALAAAQGGRPSGAADLQLIQSALAEVSALARNQAAAVNAIRRQLAR